MAAPVAGRAPMKVSTTKETLMKAVCIAAWWNGGTHRLHGPRRYTAKRIRIWISVRYGLEVSPLDGCDDCK